MNDATEYSCEICGSNEYSVSEQLTKRLVGEKKAKFNVVKCKKCQLHSLYPIPTDSDLQWIYKDYCQQGARLAVEKLRIERIYPGKIQKIKKYQSSPKILDIGAGLGGFCYVCKRQRLEIIGIEMVAQQVKNAKKIFDVDLMNLSINEFFATNKEKFDVVHMHHVLEHLQHPKSVLASIGKVLAPAGIVIFEIPNQFFVFSEELKIKLRIKPYRKPYNPYHHIYFFSPNTLKKLIDVAGYKIIELNQIKNNRKSIRTRIHKALAKITNMGYSGKIEAIIGQK
jgi:2-polyprenyl-3-methyl-5-hydroxy-6-metoxy-1,4-benzoquinol methylase